MSLAIIYAFLEGHIYFEGNKNVEAKISYLSGQSVRLVSVVVVVVVAAAVVVVVVTASVVVV